MQNEAIWSDRQLGLQVEHKGKFSSKSLHRSSKLQQRKYSRNESSICYRGEAELKTAPMCGCQRPELASNWSLLY